MEWLNRFPQHHEVVYLSPVDRAFEDAYLNVREKEGRLLEDDLVRSLPALPVNHPLAPEWQIRQLNYKRLLTYLKDLKGPLRVLDLGCGNGWFTHQVAENTDATILGLDINVPELEQAARLFTSDQCRFTYGEIYSADLPLSYFDLVLCNASIQYFENLESLYARLQQVAKSRAEWHIIDSPLYEKEAIASARKRTETYYTERSVSAMNQFYFHHAHSTVKKLGGAYLYRPNKLLGRIARRLGLTYNPFPWIRIPL